jgi:tRNA threonylcarbamoyl adenosine modification protein (Sua5/YciO/YrdC/YwlC family)
MLAKRRKVGIRIPDNVIVQTLVATLNNPILNTSVGSETDEFMNNPEVIEKTVGHAVDLILDGGIIISQPSTIFDLTEDDPVLIREGKGDPALVY